MNLKVLGSGDAFASEGKYNTSFLLEMGNDLTLVDCGASTLIRLKQERVPIENILHVIITHFHGDHYGGIPFIVITRYVEMGNKDPFTIVGPKGIRDKVYQLQEAMYPGTTKMLDEIGVEFVELNEKEWVVTGDIKIYARKVEHAQPSNPHGIKLKYDDKVFAFSGDTEWTDALVDLAEGADLFICECNNYKTEGVGHLSYKTIMEKLPLLKAHRVYLTHMGTEVLNAHEFDLVRLADGMEFTI